MRMIHMIAVVSYIIMLSFLLVSLHDIDAIF